MLNLPTEIWLRIFENLVCWNPYEAKNNGALLRICRNAFSGGLPVIYFFPKLNAKNYAKFFNTISETDFGKLVHHINLTNISYTSKASITSRLLRRCAENLESFSGPQTGLGFTALRALSNCTRLKKIDLSVLSERIDLQYLFAGIRNLQYLEYIDFPALSKFSPGHNECWPPSLVHIGFAGAITDGFVAQSSFPPSLKSVCITNCPQLTDTGLFTLLSKVGEIVTSVTIQYPMAELSRNALDCVFQLCPYASVVSVPANYITSNLFESLSESETSHKVEHLEISYSGGLLTTISLVKADDIVSALADGKLPQLRRLQYSIRLGWKEESEDVQDLVDLIDDQGGEVFVSVK
ncbi:F-box protein Pof5 [Schizosaccharomyces osmophilus]|uniref:F-box protein Pof5 n=1 Tax=Schizosaccharomyces osmophilus TaxID=2545709 RepID=A0AAF0AUN4_9SCHI|nr:F-box protein Pof5 [Schizosaccharomyces osmophilus]WBW72676.1 F-box protein Pof5 [Schizosaccharomyces osmophilus]